jgi:predicted small lipoprotein YifL
MLRGMNKRVLLSLVALSLVSLTGCPEKKPDGEPASGKAAATAAPANAPAASANAPKPGGGW